MNSAKWRFIELEYLQFATPNANRPRQWYQWLLTSHKENKHKYMPQCESSNHHMWRLLSKNETEFIQASRSKHQITGNIGHRGTWSDDITGTQSTKSRTREILQEKWSIFFNIYITREKKEVEIIFLNI